MINTAKKNIILIGFMGSGKTVIGRQVARLLDYEFADTDEEIKEVTGLELTQLFRKHGEIRFRSEERLAVKRLSRKDNMVIACGGSLPPQQENLTLLHEKGWIVLLSAEIAVLSGRLKRKNTRLLIHGKLKEEEIAQQVAEWEKAVAPFIDFKLDSGQMDIEQAAQIIAQTYISRNSQQT